MKKYLLPYGMKQFKANLHCHSTLSDGKMTPEELAKAYKEKGYSVLAITDHEFMLDHSDLNTDDFITLTSYELQIVDDTGDRPRPPYMKCCHMCFYSKDPHDPRQVFFNPDARDLRRLCKVPEVIPDLKYIGRNDNIKRYDVALINEIVKTANENGMLVSYNHPAWSLEKDEDYCNMNGFYAMEIYNNDCQMLGIESYSPDVYDRMLRSGQRLACAATDDCHAAHPLGDPLCDLFGGFSYILAESLTYDNIIGAMEKGEMYASRGPRIFELYSDAGEIYVNCSNAKEIALTTGGRRAELRKAAEGEWLSEARFSYKPEDSYIRVTVKDEKGLTANTRGYFIDELC